MVTIEILESCAGVDFSYSANDVAEVSPDRASDLVKHNLARYAEPQKPETAKLSPKAETRKK